MSRDEAVRRMHDALKVIVLDVRIRTWLASHDPAALAQADNAIEDYEHSLMTAE